MTVLSSKQILKDYNVQDVGAITALTLTHKALSDVSCLSEFKNLERLDLSFNSLSSLEGLKSCVNLKWLSVVQNKLQNLRGIEGHKKLTVLNAGKNQLRSMDEVKSLVSLRALILNDNEIVSLCKLDETKELNTLVLSRNPIREIGESLFKVKSITKLSLSNCHLEKIGSSLKSCTELKELRLAHNDIKTLPAELAYNTKIQNLDMGNNVITSLSDLKVLSSLVNLRNLNIQGNPIAEKDKLAKKIKKIVPNLLIYNARPMNKEKASEPQDNSIATEEEVNKKFKKIPEDKSYVVDNEETPYKKLGVQDLKDNKRKINEFSKEKASDHDSDISHKGNNASNKKSKKPKQTESVIDDGEIPYIELIAGSSVANFGEKMGYKAVKDASVVGGALVTFPKKKKKKTKSQDAGPILELLSSADEIGLGGLSAWGDE